MIKNKIKNYLIFFLVIVLVWSWFDLDLSYSKLGSLDFLTGAFVSDHFSEMEKVDGYEQGVENKAYYLGNKDAAIAIVMFLDFECSDCQQNLEAINQVKEKYAREGKVRIIFRNLPLNLHRQAEPAALAALCAGEQEKFWQYHDILFQNQNHLSKKLFFKFAADLKLDQKKFSECFYSETYLDWILADKNLARRNRITDVPAYLINGELVKGIQTFSSFERLIERKLIEHQ